MGHRRHSTEEKREIATRGIVLRTEVGSGVTGTALVGTDDHDEMGICLEPPGYVTGLYEFEQYEYRTAWEREPGVDSPRSRAGDTDLVIYGARKWARLAAKGNPTVLTPLFAPPHAVYHDSVQGTELRQHPEWFWSKESGGRFLGYSRSQRKRMTGEEGGMHGRRWELIEAHGYDIKHAAHMVRLAWQGLEWMRTGRLTLPLPGAVREIILEIRRGEWTLDQCIRHTEELEGKLTEILERGTIPERANYDAINDWLMWAYDLEWNS